MGVLIDASVLIGHERAELDFADALAGRDEGFFLSVVTASELLHGVHGASDASVRGRRSAYVEAVLASFPLLEVDVSTARAHSRLWAELAAAGRMIGAHDLWIASSCLARGLTLATVNERDFGCVPGLDIEVWGPVS